MRCTSCNLDNDPALRLCARCNQTLIPSGTGVTNSTGDRNHLTTENLLPADKPSARHSATWPLVAMVAVIAAAITTVLVIRELRPEPQAAPPPTTPTETLQSDVQFTATPDPDPDPAGDPQAQSLAIDKLLDESVSSRRKLNQAIDRARRCAGLAGAIAAMEEVGAERRGQIARTEAVRVDGLAAGEQVRAQLREALQRSLDADQKFIRWASAVQRRGCTTTAPLTSDYRAAEADSEAAGVAKRELLAAWNPIAVQFGLATRSRDDI